MPLDIEDICERVASGQPLTSVIAHYQRGHGEFWRWLQSPEHPERWELYERARTERAHLRADEIELLLDNVECGLIPPDAARVVLDGKKWVAAKLYPRVYADRQLVDHGAQTSLVQALAELNGMPVPKKNG